MTKDPVKLAARRIQRLAYYTAWLEKNREKNNLVRRTRYKHDPGYRARQCELSKQNRERRKLAKLASASNPALEE